MASTFLELVQKFHRDSGAGGTAPSAVTGQAFEKARLVGWLQDAEGMIIKKWTRWKFMRATFSDDTVASTATVSKPSDWKQWDLDTFFLDGDKIEAVHYDKVKDEYFDTSIEDKPWRVVIMPNGDLRCDPVPDAAYTITTDYYKKHTLLVADDDTSPIPEDFEIVIMGQALMLYANFEGAPEIYGQGAEIYGTYMPRLEDDQLPNEDSAQYKGSGGFVQVVAE